MSSNRDHIEDKYKWDLTTIFSTDKDWEKAERALATDLKKAKTAAGHLLDSGQNLLETTELYLALSRRLEKIYVYASMKNDEDTTVAKYQEFQAKATALVAKFSQAFAFYEPEFMQLSKEKYQNFLTDCPQLIAYSHFFEKLFQQKEHVLSHKEEELLAAAGEIFGSAGETFEILDNADIAFPTVLDEHNQEVELTHGNFITLMESKDRTVRKAAYV